jgi:ABC-2 type transport system ATP-binding protein
MEVRKGITGFLGPNAAGKTTTIKMLMGILKPTSGRAFVLGIDPKREPLKVRERVGFMPETPRPYKDMNAVEFLNFIGKLRGVPSKERKSQVSSLLEKVGLQDRPKDRIKGYSRGMVQRLYIAQTLMGNPDLVILDEPTAGLDPIGREAVINLLKELGKMGKSVFISSHILGEVERASADVMILDRGQLILQGDVQKIREDFASGTYRIKTDKPEVLQKELSQQPYVKDAWIEEKFVLALPKDDKNFRDGLFELSKKSGCELFSMEKEMPSLQDVFVSLIKKRGGNIK